MKTARTGTGSGAPPPPPGGEGGDAFRFRFRFRSPGMTLLELLVAFFVLLLLVGALVSLSTRSVRLIWTAVNPSASATSSWVSGRSQLSPSTSPPARARVNISQKKCASAPWAGRWLLRISHSRKIAAWTRVWRQSSLRTPGRSSMIR